MKLLEIMSPFEIVQGVLTRADIQPVLKLVGLDIRERGIPKHELDSWIAVSCPFPHLRLERPLLELADRVINALRVPPDEIGTICEPQFIFHLPEPQGYNLPPPHIDAEPPWAEGRKYARIVGVPMTEWCEDNGTLRVWVPGPMSVELDPGDLVVIAPDLEHASGLNTYGAPRLGIYFRWLEPGPAKSED